MIKLNQTPSSEEKEKLVVHSTDRYLLKYRNMDGPSKVGLFILIGIFAIGLQLAVACTTVARWGVFGVRDDVTWIIVGSVMALIGLGGAWTMVKSSK